MAAETGCNPSALLAAPPTVFQAMVRYLREKSEQENEKQRRQQMRAELDRRL